MDTTHYYLLIGSNLGDRLAQLQRAAEQLQLLAGTIESQSAIYETEPWGHAAQPWFLNQAVKLSSAYSPEELLAICKQIEVQLGRTPGEKWHARHLDIDILFQNGDVFTSPKLTIPHPHVHERNFALLPLMDIAADLQHPVLLKSIEELYMESRDPGEVYIFNADEQGVSL